MKEEVKKLERERESITACSPHLYTGVHRDPTEQEG